jgi:hypothetical protein
MGTHKGRLHAVVVGLLALFTAGNVWLLVLVWPPRPINENDEQVWREWPWGQIAWCVLLLGLTLWRAVSWERGHGTEAQRRH